MKTILLSAVVVSSIATTSFASWTNNSGVSWNGNSGNVFTNGCVFKDHDDGTMTFDAPNKTWKTTKAATIKVKSRGKNNIKVTSDNKLYDSRDNEVADVTVNYKLNNGVESAVSTTNNQAAVNINNNEMAVGNVNSRGGAVITTFTIGGGATMTTAALDELNNGMDYKINHTVTCLQ